MINALHFEPGDRVLIIDKKHPWAGQTGVLTEKVIKISLLPKPMRQVKLDNGFNAGVDLEQLQILK